MSLGKNLAAERFLAQWRIHRQNIPRFFFIDIMLARQVQRKRIPELGSAEPEGALVLSCPS